MDGMQCIGKSPTPVLYDICIDVNPSILQYHSVTPIFQCSMLLIISLLALIQHHHTITQ